MKKDNTDMELGSNFELDITQLSYKQDNIFSYLKDYHAVYTDSGRSALKILDKTLKKGIVLFPAYICESVIDVYKKDNQIRFYKINRDMTIDIDDLQSKMDSHASSLLAWDSFEDMLLSESKRIFTLYDDRGRMLAPSEKTLPI